VDGNVVEAVDVAAGVLVAEVRAGGGARFLHAVTYRVKGHVSVDAAAYRDAVEVARALEQDPMRTAADRLVARGMGESVLAGFRAEADAEIARAVAVAHAAPWPEVAEAYRDVQDVGAGRWI
jgi:pyruvate dehydrogenase E1 component alpha subunit